MKAGRGIPELRQVVVDCADARALAEFYRQLLNFQYRPGDEPPAAGEPDVQGGDWLVLCDSIGAIRLAFQQVAQVPGVTWPEGPIRQQMHLDLTVPTVEDLDVQHQMALALGASILHDRSRIRKSLCAFTRTPPGHPFCIFVAKELAP